MTETALVTGANGFVGNAVARHLLDHGWRVRTLVRKGSDRRTLEDLSATVVEGDLRDPRARADALHGADALFHVADVRRPSAAESAVQALEETLQADPMFDEDEIL